MSKMGKKPRKLKPLWRSDKWNACFNHWLAQCRSDGTREQYNNVLRRFFAFVAKKYQAPRTPDRITRQDIEEFIQSPVKRVRKAGDVPSPYYRNTRFIVLMSFYHFASEYIVEVRGKQVPVIHGKLPTSGIKMARTGDVDRDMEESEVAALFAAIDLDTVRGKRDYALFICLLGTGRRRREIARLRWKNLEQYTFVVNGQKRQGWLYTYLGKGKTIPETAELPAECMDAIQDYLEAAGLWGHMQPDDPVFISLWPATYGQPLHLCSVLHRFRGYARKAGIPENVVVHSLRHEHAWQRYNLNGHDILEVKSALGHADVKTTLMYIERRRRHQRGDPIAGQVAAKFARVK